jgi:two-component system, OmpR family, sensor kinase
MMFRSIKWSLQLWHGLILFLVLAGFGYTAFELQRTRELRRVDEQLLDRLATMFAPDRPPRGEGFRRMGPPDDGGGEFRRPENTNDPAEGPRRRQRTEFHISGQPGERAVRIPFDERFRGPRPIFPDELPPNFGNADFLESSEIYHVIWQRDLRRQSINAPPDLQRPQRGDPSGPLTRGIYREYVRFTPRGDVIVVGRSIATELAELKKLSLILLGTGTGILALGLVGGWFVATRAMRPIDSISSTALKISSGDLSQRIPQDETESELGRLVSVLNSTFTRLESSFAEQVRFTTDVSHELRTPVAVIVSQTQMALTRDRSAPEYRETLEACQRAAQRMRGLIESLLQLARLDAGQEQFKREPFDLANVARETIQLLEPLARERGLQIISHLAPAQTRGDAERISQVILNLVTNAIHYTPAGGTITVSTESENQLAILRVADTGAGIPAEDLPHLFDRFYRVEKSRSRDKGGSGLGLAISRAIVSAHSGTLEATSTPGEGATFTLRLPS